MESYFELVVETLTAAGYRWYETANFCRGEPADGRDLRSHHNLGYWLGHDYLGLGVGAVSTIEGAALAERAVAPRLHRGARGGPPPAARARGALAGDARRPSG